MDKKFAELELRLATLTQRINPKTDKKEWALVGGNDKVLEYFGVSKPSDERVRKSEQRVQWFKNSAKKSPRQQFQEYKHKHPRTKKTEQDFIQGYCGTYALAMHDLSGGKLPLGMLRGSREDEDVNIHSFVFHPKKDTHLLDASGSRPISEVEQDWIDSHNNYEQQHLMDDLYTDVETFNNREDFLKALKKTGHPDINKHDYNEAVKHIKTKHKLG